MNKKEFLNSVCSQDKLALSNIFDKINLAAKIEKPVYTNEFYTPDICNDISKLSDLLGLQISIYGIFENSERNMLLFSKEKVSNFPINLIKIENKSKFTDLGHRDYMGAIMSLGINRNKFGDLIVENNCCFVAVCEDISSYIIDNLTSIGKCSCSISQLELTEDNIPSVNFQEFTIIVSSLRLDCLIGSVCNISRSKAVDLIKKGSVLLNYSIAKEKDSYVPFGTTITIRGHGKYKIASDIGVTGKNRMKIRMKKFV
ncbi:YlmH family RNA-binding protein [Clostridium arbusti]|uniref:YlmH family RNA-binding protein n=1 Tax=Clostridium arbusti TaxID=1137848 RepID=UPI00028A0ADB|nr:YlmH/Sll1252 family protein [Clostridium arbusti]